MIWRIRKNMTGDFVAEHGTKHDGGVLSSSGIGYTMPAFIIRDSATFGTEDQARQYIERKQADELFSDFYDALCGVIFKHAQNDETVTEAMVHTAIDRAMEKFFVLPPDAE